jgi:hypothetical protein
MTACWIAYAVAASGGRLSSGGRIDRAMLPAGFDEAVREVVLRHVGPLWLAR